MTQNRFGYKNQTLMWFYIKERRYCL